MIEKVLYLGEIFENDILMDLSVLRSPVSESRVRLTEMGAQDKIINRGPSPAQQHMKIEKRTLFSHVYSHMYTL